MKPADEAHQQIPLADSRTNNEVIASFKGMSLEQLVSKLNNINMVENGYTQRDLALGCLTTFHHFNLSRALLGLAPPEQQRLLSPFGIVVYPGLTEPQFQAIIQYANTERWPYTSEGLFILLQRLEFENEPSLEEAFLLTPEFSAVETLFSRSDVSVDKKELMSILKEGNWKELFAFTEQQRMSQDLSPARRQKFLLDYITHHQSGTASLILLKIDPDFANKKLDDPTVVVMLKAMTIKTPESEKFALNMLQSPRSDVVWKQAAIRLYDFVGELPPQPSNRAMALSRFAPDALINSQSPKKTTSAAAPIKAAALVDVPKKVPSKQPGKEMTKQTAAMIKSKEAVKPKEVGKIKELAKPAKEIGKVKETPKRQPIAAAKTTKPSIIKDRLYIVQDGDTLWKISKRFNIEVDAVRKHNRLSTDALKPGTPIRIPI